MEIKCPRCNAPVPRGVLRCPRCFGLVVELQGCTGSCTRCSMDKKCKEEPEK